MDKEIYYELWLDNGVFYGEYETLTDIREVVREEIYPHEKIKIFKYTKEYLGDKVVYE